MTNILTGTPIGTESHHLRNIGTEPHQLRNKLQNLIHLHHSSKANQQYNHGLHLSHRSGQLRENSLCICTCPLSSRYPRVWPEAKAFASRWRMDLYSGLTQYRRAYVHGTASWSRGGMCCTPCPSIDVITNSNTQTGCSSSSSSSST